MIKLKDKKKLKENNIKTWPLIEKNVGVMFSYLEMGEIKDDMNVEDILELMTKCLQVVIGELYANTENYKQYRFKNYTEENFVDIVIDSISQNSIDIKDYEATIEYVENFRHVLWGHAINHSAEYLKLYINFNKYINKDSTFSYLKECMTIVTIECLLRKMDRYINKINNYD